MKKYTIAQYVFSVLLYVCFIGGCKLGAEFIDNSMYGVSTSIVQVSGSLPSVASIDLAVASVEPIDISMDTPLPVEYPDEPEARVQFLLQHLSTHGYTSEEMVVWERIVRAEAKGEGYALDAKPPTYVQHCKGLSGWYAVELYNGWQAYCEPGHKEGMREYSIGPFQILEYSNWDRIGCGNKTDVLAHVECAVKIQRSQGFNWTTAY